MTVHPPYNRHWPTAPPVLVVDLKTGADLRRPAPAAAVPSQPAVPRDSRPESHPFTSLPCDIGSARLPVRPPALRHPHRRSSRRCRGQMSGAALVRESARGVPPAGRGAGHGVRRTVRTTAGRCGRSEDLAAPNAAARPADDPSGQWSGATVDAVIPPWPKPSPQPVSKRPGCTGGCRSGTHYLQTHRHPVPPARDLGAGSAPTNGVKVADATGRPGGSGLGSAPGCFRVPRCRMAIGASSSDPPGVSASVNCGRRVSVALDTVPTTYGPV